MTRAALALALTMATAAAPLLADGWAGFYAPSGPAEGTVRAAAARTDRADVMQAAPGEAGICLRAILDAQERHGIPGNLLLGIGLQEAGTRRDGRLTVWPWAVNAAGEGRLFDSRDAAMAWVRDRLAAGVRSIDVGCLQINLRWHPDAFETLANGFDAGINADYAARFLRDLYLRTGDWETAAGSYHSFTPDRRAVYLSSLRRNVAVANQRADEFAALASRAPGRAPSRPAAPALPPLEGGFWAASLSQGTGAERRSLYSRQDLQPVLPVFRAQPSGDAP
ncbi:lytic transglycosylase domain-containing protein [Roseibacterium sp. SDUM158017]|uniref:lytic transglycosylase domain-containing protein n=1 Tax=Roseicyclus salinarum TaxID=3036773 RepID=UPI002414FD10|nr:lytic transglycosylase domain-containing protein [Roseibacterium sp. SDUM158017]MDG4648626.1 lytic transglycosylase domain-containing protein [Roseibacterium sp. SDUM158017]